MINGITLKTEIAPIYAIICFLRLSLASSKARVYITASLPQSHLSAIRAIISIAGSLYALSIFSAFTIWTAVRLSKSVVIILDLPMTAKVPVEWYINAKCDINAKIAIR